MFSLLDEKPYHEVDDRDQARSEQSLFDACKGFLYGSALREVLLAASGLKVSRMLLDESQKISLFPLAESHGFCVIDGTRRYTSPGDVGKAQFRNKRRSALPNEPGFVFTYVACQRELAERARHCDDSGDSEGFGELLGIPPCCRAAYKIYEPIARLKQGDLVPQVWANSGSDRLFDPWLNVAVRYFGKALLSFFPCSFHCPAAKSLAMESYRFMQGCDPGWAQSFRDEQFCNVFYTEYHGVHLIHADIQDQEIVYAKAQCRSTAKTRVTDLIGAGNRILVTGPQQFVIYHGSRTIATVDGKEICPCLFRARETEVLSSPYQSRWEP